MAAAAGDAQAKIAKVWKKPWLSSLLEVFLPVEVWIMAEKITLPETGKLPFTRLLRWHYFLQARSER